MSTKKVFRFPCGTGAEWAWYSDKDWVDYNQATSDTLEDAWTLIERGQLKTKNEKRIKVDPERFVDFDFKSDKEIKKNFKGLNKEENLVAVQRRFDDESKRRAVRRVPRQEVFLRKKLYQGVGSSAEELLALRDLFEILGGYAVEDDGSDINKVHCFVIKNGYDLSKDTTSPAWLKKALEAKKAPFVKDEWIFDMMKTEQEQETKKYLLTEISSAPPPSSSSSTKRKADDDDNKPGSKKQKVLDAIDFAADYKKASLLDITHLKGSQWEGKTMSADGEYKFTMNIDDITESEHKFMGLIEWPSLKTTTKFRGTFTLPNVFKFEEYELVKGDDVEVPTKYEGTIFWDTINGKVANNDSDEVKLSLTLVPKFDKICKTGIWKGRVESQIPFDFSISDRTDDTFSADVTWTTMDSKTKARGKIASDTDIQFEEYEVSQDGNEPPTEIPTKYQAKLNQDKIEGTYKSNMSGTFVIALS